jgi:hypothetical protein
VDQSDNNWVGRGEYFVRMRSAQRELEAARAAAEADRVVFAAEQAEAEAKLVSLQSESAKDRSRLEMVIRDAAKMGQVALARRQDVDAVLDSVDAMREPWKYRPHGKRGS